ncbi:ergosterol biosynthesis protein [Ascosphaera pollenicola]|nr:ergosterol biosynthesis protein [Ascosphaera pollenicola]
MAGLAVVSSINSLQAYVSPLYTSLIYNNSPQNPLHSRTFGTWTFLSSVVRCYAAYNIDDPLVYGLAMWTYGIALAHFTGEWLLFGSAKAQGRFISPFFVASGSHEASSNHEIDTVWHGERPRRRREKRREKAAGEKETNGEESSASISPSPWAPFADITMSNVNRAGRTGVRRGQMKRQMHFTYRDKAKQKGCTGNGEDAGSDTSKICVVLRLLVV